MIVGFNQHLNDYMRYVILAQQKGSNQTHRSGTNNYNQVRFGLDFLQPSYLDLLLIVFHLMCGCDTLTAKYRPYFIFFIKF